MDRARKLIERTLQTEGGYVDHPFDPGGVTKYGISQRSYPHLDIASLTREQAIAIYKRDYYDVMKLDGVENDKVAWKIFDMAVNLGTRAAAILVQNVVKVRVDGQCGPVTLGAINSLDPKVLLDRLVESCVVHYARLVANNQRLSVFIVGWMKRALSRE